MIKAYKLNLFFTKILVQQMFIAWFHCKKTLKHLEF